jgi:hypothetical protein
MCMKGNQGQGADYNWKIKNYSIHKLTSSRHVINIVNVLQFANIDIESHPLSQP